MNASGEDRIARALRRLTIAVWALAAVMAVLVAMNLFSYVRASLAFRTFAKATPPEPAAMAALQSKLENFHDLPLPKQIEAASVIAICRYRQEGDRKLCFISEILKQAPGTTFYYAAGDEFPEMSYYPKPDEIHGDGQLMFFVGSPAEFRYGMSFNGDRIGGLGDMPLDLLRAKIRGAAK